jgi:phospholipase/carboxylesterase
MLANFIHRYVPAADKRAPTLLVLHGTGGGETDLLPLAQRIDPDAAILSPRGRVLEHGMPRYFRRIEEGVFDLEDLARRTIELADFVEAAASHYGFDATRLFAVGYSNGANIAASLLLTRPEVLAGAILFRPMVPFEPARPVDLARKPIRISAGRQDQIVPRGLTDRLAEILTQAGADVTAVWCDAGHTLVPDEVAEAAQWFAQVVHGATEKSRS